MLDTFFSGEDRTIGKAFQEVRTLFEQWESKAEGFEYERKTEYWHTEGNFDFIGMLSEERRAAWRWQFFTRAFASGIRKVAVMDAKPLEQIAVKRYIEVLPAPFPMVRSTRATVVQGDASVFHHHSGKDGLRNQHVWIAWADAGKGPATIEIPASAESATVFTPDGKGKPTRPIDGVYRIQLEGDEKMAAPKLIVENVSMQLPSVAPPKTMSTD